MSFTFRNLVKCEWKTSVDEVGIFHPKIPQIDRQSGNADKMTEDEWPDLPPRSEECSVSAPRQYLPDYVPPDSGCRQDCGSHVGQDLTANVGQFHGDPSPLEVRYVITIAPSCRLADCRSTDLKASCWSLIMSSLDCIWQTWKSLNFVWKKSCGS